MQKTHQIILAALLLAATVSAQASSNDGFVVERIGHAVFKIAFDEFIPSLDAAAKAKLQRKNAEVTLAHGFNYFILVDQLKPRRSQKQHPDARYGNTIVCSKQQPVGVFQQAAAILRLAE